MKRLAFRPVYREHHRFVWRCLRRLGLSPDDADDAMQDVFVVVYRRLPTYESRAPIEGWLFQIAR
ncbi:MAG: sigma-70 family RNA polymerase sigma factor, partial [Myxococcales bacterium]|nr:sigma-70 family RNA polymerase sigma factor [Myxococcales bacterium]